MSKRALLVLALLYAGLALGNDGATARIVATSSTGASTPIEPVAGYAAWFTAEDLVFSDAGCSVAQTSDAGDVACWQTKGGSYGTLDLKVPGGYGAPALELNEFNGHAVIRSQAASFELLRDVALTADIFESGILSSSQGTAFAVAKVGTINGTNRCPWGDNNGYIGSFLVDGGGVVGQAALLYDGASKIARQTASAGAAHILTWHHEAGTLYSGVDDTRTGSMASTAAGTIDAGAGFLVVAGCVGPGQYLDGDLAELIFYPTALSEANRKLTERYLAAKYAVVIPY